MIIALDVDGTLYDGTGVDLAAVTAIRLARQNGHVACLVTGRRWRDLPEIVPEVVELASFAVCEDGAVLVDVPAGTSYLLAERADPRLLRLLASFGASGVVPGEVVVGMPISNLVAARRAVDQAGGGYHLVVNKESVAIVPLGCDKATGLQAALDRPDLAGVPVLAIGDAANDLPMFRIADIAVAVANADEEVRRSGVELTEASFGAGVAEAITRHAGVGAVPQRARRPGGP